MELEDPGAEDLPLEAVSGVYGTVAMEVREVVAVVTGDDEFEGIRDGADAFVAVDARIGAADAEALALEVE